MTTYELRYGRPLRMVKGRCVWDEVPFKSIHTTDYGRALSMYNKVIRFAQKHGLTWTVALWESCPNDAPRSWLIKSETINPIDDFVCYYK